MKKRTLLLVISIFVILGFTSQLPLAGSFVPIKAKYWNNLQSNQKFHIAVHNARGNNTLEIAGYFYTQKVAKQFWGEDWSEMREQTMQNLEHLRLEWGKNRTFIYVHIASHGTQFFRFRYFTFTQNRKKYPVGMTMAQAVDNAFVRGPIFSDTAAHGVLLIPREINIKETFKLWYKNESGKLGNLK